MPNKENSNKETEPGRFNALVSKGVKTVGLTGKSSIKLKSIGNYKISVQPTGESSLVSAVRSAASSQSELTRKLHPGMNLSPYASLKGESLRDRDLERVCFNQTDLSHCDFRNSQLRGARFKGCNLSGADFQFANLKDCIFEDSNMDGADLRHSQLNDARLIDCNLFAINLDGSCLNNAMIDSCSMGAQSFHNSTCLGLKMSNSQVIHGFFDEANLTGCELRNMEFRNCTLTNTDFHNSFMEECQFKGCDSISEGPIFSGGVLNRITMMDCDFQVPKLVNTQISNSLLARVDMESALLEGTCFTKVVFENGALKDCYSLDEAPSFDHCRLDHITIDHAELTHARFDRSSFVGALIRDSDFGTWTMNHTGLDGETSIE